MTWAAIWWRRSFVLTFLALCVCLAVAVFTPDRDDAMPWLYASLVLIVLGEAQTRSMRAGDEAEDDPGE